MTEQEFVDWCTPKTWAEWVDGEVILMSPVSTLHDELFVFLLRLLGDYVEEHDSGTVLTEPVQIRFAQQRRRRSPDIFFVSKARQSIIRPQHVEGAPDLIVEIVSPKSQSRDRRVKYQEYERAGVREYWIIDPLVQDVESYTMGSSGRYAQRRPQDGAIHSTVLPGFYVDPRWLWRSRRPRVSRLVAEMSRKRPRRARKGSNS